jgi:hypothetical protein
MAFDHIIINNGGMAGSHVVGHAQFLFNRRHIITDLINHLKMVFFEMFNPFMAALTIGVTVYGNRLWFFQL